METNIIEGNEIISKFIGITYDEENELYFISKSEWNKGYDAALLHLDRYANSEYSSDEDNILFFNSQWELLMPVCNKWDKFFRDNHLINSNYDEYMRLCDELDDSASLYELNDVWKQLVENIKWYNSLG